MIFVKSDLFTNALAVNPVNPHNLVLTYKNSFIQEKMVAVRDYFQYPQGVLVINVEKPIIFTAKTKQISQTFTLFLNEIINDNLPNKYINEVPETVDLTDDDQPDEIPLQGNIDNNNES